MWVGLIQINFKPLNSKDMYLHLGYEDCTDKYNSIGRCYDFPITARIEINNNIIKVDGNVLCEHAEDIIICINSNLNLSI